MTAIPGGATSVHTNSGAPGAGVTVTILAADSSLRPFVLCAECQASAGELDIKVGAMVICSKGRNRTGLWIGSAGDAVTVVADGSASGTEYICTVGYMGSSPGSALSGGGPGAFGGEATSGVDSA